MVRALEVRILCSPNIQLFAPNLYDFVMSNVECSESRGHHLFLAKTLAAILPIERVLLLFRQLLGQDQFEVQSSKTEMHEVIESHMDDISKFLSTEEFLPIINKIIL
jgi:hypothetical protein